MQPKLNLNTKYCKNTNIVVTFSTLKIRSFFGCKNFATKFLQCYVVYQCTCAD